MARATSRASPRRYGRQQALDAARLNVPTLGIVGNLDHTLSEMQLLKTWRPDMKLVLLEGVSHTGKTGIQRQPQLVAEIRQFIAEQAHGGLLAVSPSSASRLDPQGERSVSFLRTRRARSSVVDRAALRC